MSIIFVIILKTNIKKHVVLNATNNINIEFLIVFFFKHIPDIDNRSQLIKTF